MFYQSLIAMATLFVALLYLIDRAHRRAVRHAVRRAERAEMFLDKSPDAALVLAEDGEIQRFNRAAEQLFGYKAEQVLGRNVATLCSTAGGDHNGHALAQTLHLAAGTSGARCEIQVDHADGSRLNARITTHASEHDRRRWIVAGVHDLASEKLIKSALQRHIAQLVMTKDALQRHNADLESSVRERTAELQIAVEAAERADGDKSEFLANISHELRTPLHGILSFARFGINRIESADRTKLLTYFQRIEASGQTLLKLLNDLLDLSKLESSAIELECRPVDLSSAIADVADELAALAREKALRIRIPPADSGIFTWGDCERLAQVFRNVLGNAMKFSPANGEIRLSLGCSGDGAEVIVQDDGPGIPDDECEAVFDKFVQSRTTHSGSGGTGLGLSICRDIVALHHGVVRAVPTHGRGAHIRICLPLYHAVAFDDPAPAETALEVAC